MRQNVEIKKKKKWKKEEERKCNTIVSIKNYHQQNLKTMVSI